jgi:hypothetical protein
LLAQPENFLITLPVAAYPLLAYRWFWVKGEPSVLFWGNMFQWLSISAQLIYSNFLGITLAERVRESSFPGQFMLEANFLSVTGLYVFSYVLYHSTKKIHPFSTEAIQKQYSVKKVFWLYILVNIIVTGLSGIIWAFPGIVQYAYFFFFIKWGFFVVTFYTVFKSNSKSYKLFFLIAVGIEFVLGLGSFFASSFALVIVYALIGVACLQPRFNTTAIISIVIVSLGLGYIAVVWTVIKGDYRAFISKGEAVQEVLTDRRSSTGKLFELVRDVNKDAFKTGIDKLVDRTGYVQYMAAVLQYVPEVKPHQDGKIYLEAVKHYLKPRFLFPDKKALDDSKHTNEFTGLDVSGKEDATSIGIGYMSDAYIDLSYYMFFIIAALGYLCGKSYVYLYNRSGNIFWAWVFTVPYFSLLRGIYETDTNKVIGWFLIYFLVMLIVQKRLILLINKWIVI